MAIDETRTRPKSTNAIQTEHTRTNTPARLGYLLARKQRIERWAYKGRSSSISDTSTAASASLGAGSAQKRSESSFSQAGRVLNIRLLQLSEQRQKSIDRNNFEQKLFANKQALKYKDNQTILKTLSYVRKCCKYADKTVSEETSIDPKIFLEEHTTAKRSRSRSPSASPPPIKRTLSANARSQTSASLTETFLQHNKRHIQSSPINRKLIESKTTSLSPTIPVESDTPSVEDDSQKRHVQFRVHADGTHGSSQSAHILGKSRSCNIDKPTTRMVTSAQDIRLNDPSSYETRSSNSAPTLLLTKDVATEEEKPSPKIKRSLSRVSSAKNSLHEFRLHPERFLSASNRYLPLLRRQAADVDSKERKHQQSPQQQQQQRNHFSPPISRLSDGSDLTYDDAKSFLSEENEIGKNTPRSQPPTWQEHDHKSHKKLRSPTKINMMETVAEDTSERTMALARLRDREYAHLKDLIRSTPIEHILEPFSAIKTDDDDRNSISYPQQKRFISRQSSITADQPSKARQLGDILRSIDSLRCSDTSDRRIRRQVDMEKNRAKLGILIF